MTLPPADETERFSLLAGGPFLGLLRRLGMTAADQLPSSRAAVGLALFTWLLPALLAAVQSLVDGQYSGWGFFEDTTTYSRFLIAVWALILTERYADRRVSLLVRQFRSAELLTKDSQPAFARALAIADRRSSLPIVEALLLLVALVGSSLAFDYTVETTVIGWEGKVVGGDVQLSWAGAAACFVSSPFFVFLVLRWIWRFLVWTALLLRISYLPLQLTPLHPDRSAGLGFLTIYPTIFLGVVFALSCVVSSSFMKEMNFVHHDSQTVWFALAGWLVINLVVVLGPLLVFAPMLYRARERAVLEYGRLANQHHLAFHQKWICEARSGEEALGAMDMSSAADLNASVEVVREIRVVPFDRNVLIQLVVAAGVPLLGVVTKQVPIGDIIRWVIGSVV